MICNKVYMGCTDSRESEGDKSKMPRTLSKNYQFQVYAALKKDSQKELNEFIPKKFDVKYKMGAFMGRTALHIAAEYSGKGVIASLITLGADVNALDNSGCPPIFLAMASGNLEAVVAIYELGTKVNLNIVTLHNMSFHDFICVSKQKESLALLKRLNYTKIKVN